MNEEKMKESNIVKRKWEVLFDKMPPKRFDKMPAKHYEYPLSYVEDGWSVLDAGCATANLYKYAKRRNISYTGMDFCQNLLDSAKERHPDANLKLGSVLNIPFPNNSFDVVFSKSVLEHIHPDEVEVAVGELVRVAKHMLILVFHRFPDKKATETRTIVRSGYWENIFSKSWLLSVIKDTGRFLDIKTHTEWRRQFWMIYLSEVPRE